MVTKGIEISKQSPECVQQITGIHFTQREIDVLELLSKGLSNQSIADNLCVDIKTVEHHLSAIYSKYRMAFDNPNDMHLRVVAALNFLRYHSPNGSWSLAEELLKYHERSAHDLRVLLEELSSQCGEK